MLRMVLYILKTSVILGLKLQAILLIILYQLKKSEAHKYNRFLHILITKLHSDSLKGA